MWSLRSIRAESAQPRRSVSVACDLTNRVPIQDGDFGFRVDDFLEHLQDVSPTAFSGKVYVCSKSLEGQALAMVTLDEDEESWIDFPPVSDIRSYVKREYPSLGGDQGVAVFVAATLIHEYAHVITEVEGFAWGFQPRSHGSYWVQVYTDLISDVTGLTCPVKSVTARNQIDRQAQRCVQRWSGLDRFLLP